MRTFYRLLFTLFLFPLFSLAQSNYKPGYVVTLKGDTLHGFIDYRGWDANPTAISFKTAISDNKPRKLTMGDISFFSVGGVASYKKYICSISMDETNTSKLGTSRDTSYKIDTVFLQVLQKGKNVALYGYTDGLKTRFYIGEAPDYTPTELIFRLYENVEANGTTVNENTYLKQLFALANKYNALDDNLTSFLQTANYVQPDLLTIVSRINHISKAEYTKKYAERGKFNLLAGVALNVSTTSSSSGSSYSEGGGRSSTSYLPAVSFGFNFVPNPDAGRVVFRVELSLADAQVNSQYKLTTAPYGAVKLSYGQLTTSLIPQVIYNIYSSDNFKFYLGFGFLLSYTNYSNAFFGSQGQNSPVDIASSEPFYFNAVDDSFILKAGVQFNKKWEIVGNYLPSAAATKGGYWALNRTAEQIGVIYIIGK